MPCIIELDLPLVYSAGMSRALFSLEEVLNVVYLGAVKECEQREFRREIAGHGHHMAQRIQKLTEDELRTRPTCTAEQVLAAVRKASIEVCADRQVIRDQDPALRKLYHHTMVENIVSEVGAIMSTRPFFMDNAVVATGRSPGWLRSMLLRLWRRLRPF